MEIEGSEEKFMNALFICGILTTGALVSGERDGAPAGPVWLKDYAEAKAKALRESKPIFAVFR
jgi:hypothetical protein